MTSRRDFIHTSAAALATAGAIVGTASSLNPVSGESLPAPSERLKLHAVVVDQRFGESVEFGRSAARQGARTYSMRGDITDVWYSKLHPQWRHAPVAIAGLTGSGVLFCLERLAWEHDLRVVYRASHQYVGDGRIQHSMAGPADWLELRRSTPGGSTHWPTALAAAITHMASPCRALLSGAALAPTCTTAAGHEPRNFGNTLFSWVIAPPARA